MGTTISVRTRGGEALEMAQRAGIVIYTISTSTNWLLTDQETSQFNQANRKYQKDAGDRVLEQFSNDSGGRAFFPYRADDLAVSFRDIGEELRSQYSLGYVPAGRVADGRFHSIRLAISTKGLQIHAQKRLLCRRDGLRITSLPLRQFEGA